ncbi:chemotaxis protein CheC [Alkalicoccus daliensis]|uniref:Chemotaxis protein CheC n=1 Tax=Alkalicoccus daliensis TaxID=745820 RepID=A0A1H0A7Q0_9BACI|nr:chemotaxis protein CheC [Alkalicoccus daliensis]SDN28776.1 chemotaxis protein CheC [Alkalicoccus daliensis]
MKDLRKLKHEHLDILKEIGNIGAAHAATSLSQMLNKTIDMQVPAVNLIPFSELSEALGGEEVVVAAVLLRLEGEVPGNMFFMIPLEDANHLIGSLIMEKDLNLAEHPMHEMGASALSELGNILAGSYLSALSDFTKLNLFPSPPAVACDMTMAVLSFGLVETAQYGDVAIVVDTRIHEESNVAKSPVKGYFFLLPDPESLDTLFSSLGIQVDE